MATNRADTLDPALLRPGRLDRKIEFPLPNRREKRLTFQTITSQMSLSPDVDLEDYVSRPDKLSCAEISSICQAAGLQGGQNCVVLMKSFWTYSCHMILQLCERIDMSFCLQILKRHGSRQSKETTKHLSFVS